MNLLGAVNALERLIQGQQGATVQANTARCLHALCKTASCERCAACPTSAIQVSAGQGIAFDAARCVGCGACLHRCPTGVFRGEDGAAALLHCVSELPDRESLLLFCSMSEDSTSSARGVDAAIKTGHCLVALAPSLYAGLAVLGVRRIRLRLEACAGCPLGTMRAEIEATAEAAHSLLEEVPLTIECITQSERAWRKAKVITANNPPISRRGFFRRIAGQVNTQAALLADDALWQDEEGTQSNRLPRERTRMLRAMRQITGARSTKRQLSPRLGFAALEVDPSCTACGTCERACPTDALRLDLTENSFRLSFAAGNCTDCGLCTILCPADALRRIDSASLQTALIQTPETLISGTLRRCKKCGAPFAGSDSTDYCALCAFRRANPFGAGASKR